MNEVSEFLLNTYNRLRGPVAPEQVRETFLARKTELEAELSQADVELQTQVQPLYDQINAFKTASDEACNSKRAELEELNEGLRQLDGTPETPEEVNG